MFQNWFYTLTCPAKNFEEQLPCPLVLKLCASPTETSLNSEKLTITRWLENLPNLHLWRSQFHETDYNKMIRKLTRSSSDCWAFAARSSCLLLLVLTWALKLLTSSMRWVIRPNFVKKSGTLSSARERQIRSVLENKSSNFLFI